MLAGGGFVLEARGWTVSNLAFCVDAVEYLPITLSNVSRFSRQVQRLSCSEVGSAARSEYEPKFAEQSRCRQRRDSVFSSAIAVARCLIRRV